MVPLLSPEQPPRRVAVLRALQLGDLLCAVPALRTLRAALPGAEITLIGLPWAREFATRFSRYIDSFIPFPGHAALPEQPADPDAFARFLANVRCRRFDLAIQLHGSGGVTNHVAALFDAGRMAGFYLPGEWCPDPATFLPYPGRGPEVERLRSLVRFLGAPDTGSELEFPLTAADEAELARVVAAGLLREPFAVIHPGSRAEARRWPPELFAAAAGHLARRGLRVVLTGTAPEQPLAAAVQAASPVPVLDLTGQTSLGAMAALLARARVLVSNDTGVSHLAAALGVPSVVVFSASDPERWAPGNPSLHRVVDARRIATFDPVARAIDAHLECEALHA